MAVCHGADFLAQPGDMGRRVGHLRRRLPLLFQCGLGRVQLVALILRAARDLQHGAGNLTRRRGELFTDRREIARRGRDLVGRPDDFGDDAPQLLSHEAHGVGEHLEFARHSPCRHGTQIAAAESLRRRHQADQRALHPPQREDADHGADDGRGDQDQPEHDLALAREGRQPLARGARLIRLPRRQVAHQPRQFGYRRAYPDYQRLRVARVAHVGFGMREGVVDVDLRLQLLDAVHGDALGLAQA